MLKVLKHICIICIICLLTAVLPGCGKSGTQTSTVEKLLSNMTLEEKVWQMFFVAPEDITGVGTVIQAGEATKKALNDYPVGGIIYFGQNIKSRGQIKEMIAKTQSYSKIPLFLAVDEEGGRVARLGNAGVIDKQPPMREIGDSGNSAKAREIGEFLGAELKELGFNMDFAPVADVMTVGNNEDIGDRSFGTEPSAVADMVAAEVEGIQSKGVSATLKHFPGNGSTTANTHYSKAICKRTAEELRQCEFIPFKAGIDAGADAVMVTHAAFMNITGDETPSTLSPVIIGDYLRGELGFNKVVISDAFNMGAVTNEYTPEDAAVKAVQAGIDVILMSTDVKKAHAAVVDKVCAGEISAQRIDESVKRILDLKMERGLLQ